MNVPACAMPRLSLFQPACSTPPSHRFLSLALAAVLTTGRRTVTNLLRTVRAQAPGPVSSSQRGVSPRRWSAWGLARPRLTCRLDPVVPPGPVRLAGDETVTEPPGPQVFGKGRHRDGVRSPPSETASRWGHTWGVVSVLVKRPFASRPWALPGVAALSRPPEWAHGHGLRHQPPAHSARVLRARLMRWLPERHVRCVGDSGYGTSATARCCRQHPRHLPLGRQLYGEAALYEPPPPRTRGTIGRPRVNGETLASPQEVVAPVTRRRRLTVAW